MAVELIKEPLRINQAISDQVIQFAVQGDVIIPDVKPDVMDVLYIEGNISLNSREAYQDRITAEGTVDFKIIYQSNDEEKQIRSLNASLPFKETIEVLGVRTGMKISLDAGILDNEFEVLNERKISVKAIAQITVRVSDAADINLITDVTGNEDIQKQKCPVKICSFIGEGFENCSVKKEVEIPEDSPAIFEVLADNARIINNEVRISENKIIVQGDIVLTALYTSDDEEKSIRSVDCEIPYTQFIDMPGISENAICDTDVKIKQVIVKPVEDETGDYRILDCSIELDIDANVYEWLERNAVTDAYSLTQKMEIESKEISANQMAYDLNNETVIKDNLEVPEEQKIAKIYGVICKPAIPDVYTAEDKVSISGVLDVWMLYCGGEDNTTKCSRFEIPYNNDIDAKGAEPGQVCKAKVEVERCGCNVISDTEAEIKAVLRVSAKLYKDNKVKIVSKVEGTEINKSELDSQPSIIIYFVQPGDNLWKIGKKYNISVEDLVKLNDIQNPNQLVQGQQVLIPKQTIQNDLIRK